MRKIQERTFLKFKPMKNHLAKNAGWNGWLFETYGKEMAYVKSVAPEKVWTLLDVDGGLYISSGYHFVNRVGYFVTEVPWSENMFTGKLI